MSAPRIPPADPAASTIELDLARPTRRAVVKWLGAAMALSAAGCSRAPDARVLSYAHMPEIAVGDAPVYYATALPRDGWAHGVLVGTQQGRPVKVEGVTGPASGGSGGTDAATQAAVLDLWDPERSTTPWHRGADGRAAPSTWPAFLADWRARSPAWRAPGAAPGALQVLTPRITSPTTARALAALLARFPGAQWTQHDGVDTHAMDDALARAAGTPLRSLAHLDRATLVITLEADPFTDPAAGVRQAADWARARAQALAAGRVPPRGVALETTPGLFGARADERHALTPSAIDAVAWALAAQLAAGTDAARPTLRHDDASDVATLATRLAALCRRHAGRVVVLAGASMSPAVHALALAINQRFGGDGAWTAIAPPDRPASLPVPGRLADLAARLREGSVQALLVVGGNPAYTAPGILEIERWLGAVPFSAHLGLHRDETGRACGWHLPASHAFEQWGDARAADGTLMPQQPAIAPLYDTRSAAELLSALAADEAVPVDGHALAVAAWAADGVGGEAGRVAALRRGWAEGSAAPALSLRAIDWPARPAVALATAASPTASLTASSPSRAALELVFPPHPHVGTGEGSANGWLQELPHPLTRLAWGNALQLGPRTAAAHGLATGDVVRIARSRTQPEDGANAGAGDTLLEAPIWVDARHAEGACTLTRGHGRRAAGPIGQGVGVDTAFLRGADEGGATPAFLLAPAGRRVELAQAQREHDQHDRELARTLPFGQAMAPAPPPPSIYPPRTPDLDHPPGPAWAMAIDLDACIGCGTCTVACQAENNIPVVGPTEAALGRSMHWIRVDVDVDAGTGRAITQPVPCMHCEHAPCELVCPVGATSHDGEGLNVQVYNRCVGTRFCSNNCPYKVRRFNFRQYADVTTEVAALMRNPDVTVRSRGVMEKCTYCVQRLSRARRADQRGDHGVQAGPDGQATSGGSDGPATAAVQTACQAACPTQAIRFGNLHDAAGAVAQARQHPRHYVMLEELNTRPRTTYLARVGPVPEEGDA